MGYDIHCYELAALFLGDEKELDTEANRDELASHIQFQIELWLEGKHN